MCKRNSHFLEKEVHFKATNTLRPQSITPAYLETSGLRNSGGKNAILSLKSLRGAACLGDVLWFCGSVFGVDQSLPALLSNSGLGNLSQGVSSVQVPQNPNFNAN